MKDTSLSFKKEFSKYLYSPSRIHVGQKKFQFPRDLYTLFYLGWCSDFCEIKVLIKTWHEKGTFASSLLELVHRHPSISHFSPQAYLFFLTLFYHFVEEKKLYNICQNQLGTPILMTEWQPNTKKIWLFKCKKLLVIYK